MKFLAEKPYRIKILFYAAAVVLCLYLGSIVFGGSGFFELQRLQRELAALKAENVKLEEKNQALYRTIRRLKNDPEYIEHVARQELQMIGEDEVVFKFRKKDQQKQQGD